MAERRMFAKKITESDAFLDMPSSTQMLYFHLSMNADDDGFVNNPKKILKFHKNQINGEKIAEKRFSQPIADIITVVVYAGIGVLIYSLIH